MVVRVSSAFLRGRQGALSWGQNPAGAQDLEDKKQRRHSQEAQTEQSEAKRRNLAVHFTNWSSFLEDSGSDRSLDFLKPILTISALLLENVAHLY